jgi:23S rRNA pseudouridine1911/1915/1917 synthase
MITVPLLHRDDHLVVVDKPAGVLVVPAGGRSGPTIVDLVSAQLGQPAIAVHRLDEQTTGCLVLALDERTQKRLDDLFREHAIERDYLALLTAAPSPPSGRIEANLAEGDDGVVRVVRRGGKRAVTHYETIERRDRCTLVRCRLETGRRNQIRAHLAALGCPVAGDRKYGYRARPGERFDRVMLHSHHMRFRHPVGGHDIDLTCPPGEPELRP